MGIPYDEFNYQPAPIYIWDNKVETKRFFIAAPAQEMTPLEIVGRSDKLFSDDREEKIKSLSKFARFIQTKDPFFCSCTEYGVLIFSKWGDEAQDEIIKRYEQLSQAVNN